jgi:hypothetical protein
LVFAPKPTKEAGKKMPASPPIRNKAALAGKTLLVGLGAQKAGTTWLSSYLGAHPRVFVPLLGGEVHYFDTVHVAAAAPHRHRRNIEVARRFATSLGAERLVDKKKLSRLLEALDRMRMTQDPKYSYLSFFADRVRDDHDVFCDITPSYAALDAAAFRAIERSHSKVKYLFIMRDPVTQFWSGLRMRQKKAPGFDARTRFGEALENPSAVALSDYRRTIEEVETAVEPSRLKFIFFEHLFRADTIADLMSFLGLEAHAAPFGKVVNAGIPVEMPDDFRPRALARLRHVYDYVFQRFGDQVPAQWHETASGPYPASSTS